MNKKYLVELIGTAVLVLAGCGAASISGMYVGVLGIAAAFGLSVLVMVYAIGPVSGCHINPAVTIGALIDKRINSKDALNYIIFQFAGAAIGAAILYFLVSNGFERMVYSLGQNAYGAASLGKFSAATAFVAETVFTAVFVFVVLAATAKNANAKFAGVAIGLALLLIHIVCIPITGTSVNPARSFGPALFMGVFAIEQLWLFIAAPAVGGVIGAYVWKAVKN
jgi:aquaporin Z